MNTSKFSFKSLHYRLLMALVLLGLIVALLTVAALPAGPLSVQDGGVYLIQASLKGLPMFGEGPEEIARPQPERYTWGG